MIYTEMYGRLGNQLFRYAVSRTLQLEFYPNEELCFDFKQVEEAGRTDPSFYDALKDFNVHPYSLYKGEKKPLFSKTSIAQKIVCARYYLGLKKIDPENMTEQVVYEKRWVDLLNKYGIYWYRNGYFQLTKSTQKDKFVSGNFEAPQYFEKYRDILLNEITPIHNRLSKNDFLYDVIENSNSVCISIRRGDFETNAKFKKIHSVCDKNYFLCAIDLIKSMVPDAVIILFSDDIEWAKKNIITNCKTYYEDGTDPVWEKMRLMSSCKHFIISNSTFSWWCQWLSQNENKIVISPNRWFNNDYNSWLLEDQFIKVDTEKIYED